jgi:hypothetical protein
MVFVIILGLPGRPIKGGQCKIQGPATITGRIAEKSLGCMTFRADTAMAADSFFAAVIGPGGGAGGRVGRRGGGLGLGGRAIVATFTKCDALALFVHRPNPLPLRVSLRAPSGS